MNKSNITAPLYLGSFRYAATSEGNKCWCGNDTTGLTADPGNCTKDCTGLTDSSKCGGTVSFTSASNDEYVRIEQADTPDLIEGLVLGAGGKETQTKIVSNKQSAKIPTLQKYV